jgi:alkyldihydroxyacetonephosphate synthase
VTNQRQPLLPIDIEGGAENARVSSSIAPSPSREFLEKLAGVCAVETDLSTVTEASRDWWPHDMHWALKGVVTQRAAVACRPTDTKDVSDILSLCNDYHIPVTAAAGRSGVSGGSIPLRGGVILDMCAMRGVTDIDEVSGIVEVLPGTFGPELEEHLAPFNLTVGHFPQSFDISTVGGWIACRGAGQFSTRFGKIDDMVVALEVVLADGTVVRTSDAPSGADGPDRAAIFIGSEGTLGIVTRAWLRAHPRHQHEWRSAWSFESFEAGMEACRRIVRAGATPAVLRLYDEKESQRSHGGDGTRSFLLVLDTADEAMLSATRRLVEHECESSMARHEDTSLVANWLSHRNDTSGLQALTKKGFVIDTMEVAAPWSRLKQVRDDVVKAFESVAGCRLASCHLSHSYIDGACLYFTFAATPGEATFDATYDALWNSGQRAALRAGANLSHHHGVGLNRARFMDEALGNEMVILRALKNALDPNGILNPGKLGL